MRVRLDAAAAREETTKSYVERLETLVDEARLPSGDDLISEIERFLREGGNRSISLIRSSPDGSRASSTRVSSRST